VLVWSAFKNKAVQPMLDAVVDYLPSPLDVPPTVWRRAQERNEIERTTATTSRSRPWRSDHERPFRGQADLS